MGMSGQQDAQGHISVTFPSQAKALRSLERITGKDQRALVGRKIGAISEVKNLGT